MKRKTALILVLIAAGMIHSQTGGILWEHWNNLSGITVSDLANSTSFPCNPSGFSVQPSFSAPKNMGDNYGARMRGFIAAPVTGNYVFWICGDDNCELWLSSDKSTLNKSLIARASGYTGDLEWTKYPEQKSSEIYMEAGKLYYIEALHKEGSQGDHVSVGWQMPGGALERPIGGNRLIPWPVQENYSSWNYSTSIMFNTTSSGANINTDIVEFPVLVRLGAQNSEVFNQALPEGYDIRFADPDGTPLHFEIVRWNSSTKEAAIWVKVPTITANSNTDYIRMYWGKSDALPKSESDAVFSYVNNFSNVWHLDDNKPNQNVRDASGHFPYAVFENGGSHENTSLHHTAGVAGGALDFVGNNRISLYNFTPVQNDAEFTISAWVYADQLSSLAGIWFTPEWGSFGKVRLYGNSNWVYENGTGTQSLAKSTPSSLSQWVQLAVTQKVGSNLEIFVNGDSKGSAAYPSKGPHGVNSFIGSEEWSNYFDGKIDEVTYSKTVRSADWIKLWYESQKPSQKFITFGVWAIEAPSGFTASNNGNEIVLSWVDNASNETGYEISRMSGTSLPLHLARVGANVTNYIDPDISCGSQYVYMVKTVNGSSESQIIESNKVYLVPCKPGELSATQLSESEVSLTWSGNETEFVLEGKSQSGSTYTEIYRGAEQQYVHSGVTCQSSWEYRVKAINPAGSSDWANATITTGACEIAAPEDLTADNSTPEQITLAWVDVSSNEDGFRIYRKQQDESNFSLIASVLAANGSGVYVDNTITCNTVYSYYVVAYNSNSVSGPSPRVTVTTSYCGAGKSTSEMISINGMYLDVSSNPVTGTRLAVVKIYSSSDMSQDPVYEESFTDIECRNGYFSIPIGLTGDIASVVRNHSNLYFDVIIDGISVYNSNAQPLTASPYSIKNSFNLAGNGSPIDLQISAPIGATWVDMVSRLLYIKYGSDNNEWKQIGN